MAESSGSGHIRTESAPTLSQTEMASWLAKQCREIGISEPSAVQLNCIPAILSGRDVLGCSKTGTGKTLAFAIPILQQLAQDPFGVFALVLTPTRELAFQIADQFRVLGKPISVRLTVIVGGRDMVDQSNDLHRHPHIVISTPGRLADHIDSVGADQFEIFSKLKFLVLDEADRLLDGQYSTQLRSIFSVVPKRRQTLLFSATITDALSHLHQLAVTEPYFYEDTSQVVTVEELEQRFVLCPIDVKDAYLVYVVKNFHEKHPESSVLIFAQTCRECQALTGMFRTLGFRVGPLHSQIAQKERLSSLTNFRSGKLKIMLSTDVAARGLDIPHVDLVVNHNVPRLPKTYVHRVGRSARAGRFGTAISFVTQYDVTLIQAVEEMIGTKLIELKVNDKKVSQYVTEVLVAKRESEIKLDRQKFGERKEINRRKQMIIEGLDPDQVEMEMKEAKIRREKESRERVKRLKKRTGKLDRKSVQRIDKKRKKLKREGKLD